MKRAKIKYQKQSFHLPHPMERGNSKQFRRPQLVEPSTLGDYLRQWMLPMFLLLGSALLAYLAYAHFAFEGDWSDFFQLALGTTPDSVENATSFFVELLAAILGIVITVVAIVLQLAAQRYGTRLIDLFLGDRINRLYFFLMVFSVLLAVLIVHGLKGTFYPRASVILLLAVSLLEIALVAPYFLYVFKFLTPTNLLSSIQQTAKENVKKAMFTDQPALVTKAQKEVALSLEQVTDTALSANSQGDRNLGLMAINQIREMLLDYLEIKKDLSDDWFKVNQEHFIGISSEFYKEICEKQLWYEAKSFMDMELIYKTCIKNMPDAVSAIAHNTRVIGEQALLNKDKDLLEMVIQFFNTYLRISLNEKNVRAIFNLFYQYRKLNESLLKHDPEQSSKVLFYFRYYGETCLQQGMWFVMYTAAFDIANMLITAYNYGASNMEELLNIFLEMEDNLNREQNPQAFYGVRKAQVILATYLYSLGERRLVQVISQDLRQDSPEELNRWKTELLNVKSRKFWEITDRGVNLEYIDDTQKAYLVEFFATMIETVEPHP